MTGFVEALAKDAGVRGWTDDAVAAFLADPSSVAVLEPPRGFALGRLVLDEAELDLVVVAAEHRRRGHGRALLAAFERAASQRGAHVVHLEVSAQNSSALALYEAAGYERVGRRPRYYEDGADALLFTKRLVGLAT